MKETKEQEEYHSDIEDVSICELIEFLNTKDLRRIDGELNCKNKKYKYSAYTVNQYGSGKILYRVDIREVNT